jgi:hypothetical protein
MLQHSAELVGDYHLLLAHDVLENRAGWKDWANALRAKVYDPTIIMDSSVIELGMPMAMSDIMEAASIVNADVVVLPDVIGDIDTTHSLCLKFQDQWHATPGGELQSYEYMFVPQGKDLADYIESIKFMGEHLGICNWVGLPRDCHELGVKSRRELIDVVNDVMMHRRPKIHLLGISNVDLIDDVLCANYRPNVVGIDSAVPTRAGWMDRWFTVTRTDYGERGNYWKAGTLTERAIKNIEYARTTFR